jgi:uncharacterized membrane protein
MQSRLQWLLTQLARKLWFRATLFSILAVGTAFIAVLAKPYIPDDLETKIGADAVDNVLGIIASSMLAVTIFSLSTMVSAFTAATNNVSPRATKLLMEDSTAQNALATFIGSFLFSVVGIIVLSTGAYGDGGRVIVFIVTIGVIAIIVITLLRWIDHLSRLGRVGETTEKVEDVTMQAMRDRIELPYLGGLRLSADEEPASEGVIPVFGQTIGYVQHVDAGALSELAEEAEGTVHVVALPGTFIDPSRPLAFCEGMDEEAIKGVVTAFTVGDERSFDQDPRFGLCVMSEIASRALSTSLNDPGTAIDVIGRALRVLSVWSGHTDEEEDDVEVIYPRLRVRPLGLDDLFDDIFTPIARDGATIIEVQVRLQKVLLALGRLEGKSFRDNAIRHSRLALTRAEAAMAVESDLVILRELSGRVEGLKR